MSASGLVRALGALGVAATLGLGTMPAFAQPAASGGCSTIDFSLANPTPGARVEAGANIFQGVAMATNAPNGANGVDRVDFFLGSRDEGGIIVGSAVPAMTTGPFGPGSFQATVDFSNVSTGSNDLWAYAHNSISGQQAVISMPIAIGEDASRAFVTQPTPDSLQMMCIGSAAGVNQTGVTSTTQPPATTPAPPTTTTTAPTGTIGVGTTQTMVLEVGNPSPGDTIHVGAYNIIGRAFDKAATTGSGIDRIEVFLDNRDAGGLFLGTGTMMNNNLWSAMIDIPNNQTGLHTLTFYAHSAVSGAELVVEVPVTVAQ
jgi:hypothetical protein